MAKRIKSDKPVLIPIPDWRHAEEYVKRIGNLTMKVTQAEHQAKDDIDEIKADLQEKVKALQEKMRLYVKSLEQFAADHKSEFQGQKSRKLAFGSLGWRRSTSIKVAKKTLQLIKEVFSKTRAAALVRVKETVDKEALARLKDEQLAKVGARRERKEVFFVEPDIPEAVDYT